MRVHSDCLTSHYEAVLASHVVDLTTEFRGYDAADLIAMIRLERFAELRSLLEGDCKEIIKPSTMLLGDHAEAVVRWDAPPSIRLSMVFRHLGVELYYRVTLEAAEAFVEIELLRFDDDIAVSSAPVAALERALSDAKTLRHL